MYDLEGHFLEVLEAETYQGIIDLLPVKASIKSKASIQKAAKGERNFAGIYQFRDVTNDRPLHKIGDCSKLKKTTEKAVHKYYKGAYINTYRNIQEASVKNNINHSNIVACLKDKVKSSGGFEWKYAE